MTKKEIVRTISEEIGLTQLQTKEIVQRTFDAIVDTLVEDTKLKLQRGGTGSLGRIELRNFGVFEVKRRAPRWARNPRIEDPKHKVFVPAKLVVTFKPGKEMEERVRELEQHAAAAEATEGDVAGADSSPRPVAQTSGAPTGYGSSAADA